MKTCFPFFDKLVIQASLKWIKEWNKVQEECMKEIEECLLGIKWICSSLKWCNNQNNSLFDLYCKATKMLILLAWGQLKLKLHLFFLWCNFLWLAVDACQDAFIMLMPYMDAVIMFSRSIESSAEKYLVHIFIYTGWWLKMS